MRKMKVRFYCGCEHEDFIFSEDISTTKLIEELDLWIALLIADAGWEIEGYVDEDDTFDYGEDELLDYLYIDSKP